MNRDTAVFFGKGQWHAEHEKALDLVEVMVEALRRLKAGHEIYFTTLQEINADRLSEDDLRTFWALLVDAQQTAEQRTFASSEGELPGVSPETMRRAFQAISDAAMNRRQ